MKNSIGNKKLVQGFYKQELEKILSLTKGETFEVDYSSIYTPMEYEIGRDQAIEYATEKGYIESISFNLTLFGQLANMKYKRL